MSFDDIERQQKLLQLVKQAIQEDTALRSSLAVGDRFRFIRDRLNALLAHMEKTLEIEMQTKTTKKKEVGEDETIIYVYLYNTHGLVLQTWQKMLKPELFYEYSINRPIYLEKTAVETFIRNKTNQAQHGYLTLVIPKSAILSTSASGKDLLGQVLAKVKEGALKFDNLLSFTHANKEYMMNENHELVRKKS